MRWGDAENGESASTDIPVVLGESGEAMIGSGMVRRLRYVGVWGSGTDTDDTGAPEDGPLCEDVELLVVLGEMFSSTVDRGCGLEVARVGLELVSSASASRDRSSHFPLRISKLLLERCEGAHLLEVVDEFDEPVGVVRMPTPD